MTDEFTPGREPIVIVEIEQDLCVNQYSILPCTAAIGVTGSQKCFNTFVTCQDKENYALGSPLKLRFCKANQRIPDDGNYYFPFLVSATTTPSKINIGGGSRNRSPLGTRAVATIKFGDYPHSDRVVDPYLGERSYDPLAKGTFWTKWLARNLYRSNRVIRIYEGYYGQTLAEMNVREYLIDRISGPTSSGALTITAKDPLKLAEAAKAEVPRASTGQTSSELAVDATSIRIVGLGVETEYPSSGIVRINDEIMSYSGLTVVDSGFIELTGVVRGLFGSIPDEHDAEDRVQICRRIDPTFSWDIVYDLLIGDAGVPSIYIDKAEWDEEGNTWLNETQYETLLSEPISVNALIAEIIEQANFYIWWDERAAKIRMRAIRPFTDEAPLLTEESNILQGSVSVEEKADERASQIWVYWDIRNFAGELDEDATYRRINIRADLNSESEEQYGEPIIRKIYSRWIQNTVQATNLAFRLLSRYVDPPRELKLELDAKDRSHWTADIVRVQTRLITDFFGDPVVAGWQIISSQENTPGHKVSYTLQESQFQGKFAFWMADTANDFTSATETELARGLWLADDDGFYSDGTEGYKWQ